MRNSSPHSPQTISNNITNCDNMSALMNKCQRFVSSYRFRANENSLIPPPMSSDPLYPLYPLCTLCTTHTQDQNKPKRILGKGQDKVVSMKERLEGTRGTFRHWPTHKNAFSNSVHAHTRAPTIPYIHLGASMRGYIVDGTSHIYSKGLCIPCRSSVRTP